MWPHTQDVENISCLPASNMFPGLDSVEAVVAVQKHPPRCMAITAAASALQSSGFQSFFDDRSGGVRTLLRPRAEVVDALISFALCFSPLVPVGIAEVGASPLSRCSACLQPYGFPLGVLVRVTAHGCSG